MVLNDYFVQPDLPVSGALEKLDRSGQGILFLTEDGRPVGVVTDGDIRRWLIRGGDLAAPISAAAKGKPIAVQGYHEMTARRMVREQDLTCVPMLDRSGRIHELVFGDAAIHRAAQPCPEAVVMMAGGMGTRLQPFTNILPKPLIPVGERTITERIMEHFRKFGFERFSLVVNYKKELIKSYFAETECPGLSFVEEREPLGTGGGLRFFQGQFTQAVFVTNCDTVIEADYAEILARHRSEGNTVTMVCVKKKEQVPYGVVRTDESGALAQLLEKPQTEYLVNTGFYVVSPAFLDAVPEGPSAITDLILAEKDRGNRVGVYTIEDECFIDMGQLDDLADAAGRLI